MHIHWRNLILICALLGRIYLIKSLISILILHYSWIYSGWRIHIRLIMWRNKDCLRSIKIRINILSVARGLLINIWRYLITKFKYFYLWYENWLFRIFGIWFWGILCSFTPKSGLIFLGGLTTEGWLIKCWLKFWLFYIFGEKYAVWLMLLGKEAVFWYDWVWIYGCW